MSNNIEPSDKVIKNICDAKKFCRAQGKITFGQLKSLVTNAKVKKLLTDVGEGGYKATIRILPWFFPQLILAGFTGSILRAFNKIFRPAMEDTTGYKTWWGKTITNLLNLVEGDLNINDPLSKIFFISDGLLTMLDSKEKIKFARHIASVASEKPDDEEVPEFFVENELRNWVNEKFLLNPPLGKKEVNQDDELPFDEINENGIKRRTFSSNTNESELKWHFDKTDRKVKIIKSDGWQIQMDNKLPITLKEGQIIKIPKGMYHRVIKGNGDLVVKIKEFTKKNDLQLLESTRQKEVVKTLVKDIIRVYSKEDDGEFYLPNYIDDSIDFYNFTSFDNDLTLNLTLNPNNKIDDFDVKCEYIKDSDILEVTIDYNLEIKNKITYDLIGVLNDILENVFTTTNQKLIDTTNLEKGEDPNQYEYYTNDDEIKTQIIGFNRLSELTKVPFDVIVKQWFKKNKSIHKLNDEQIYSVVSKILNYKQ